MRKTLWLLSVMAISITLSAVGIKDFKNFSGNKRVEMKKEGDTMSLKLLKLDVYDTETAIKIKDFTPNTIYEFSCDVDAELRNLVYLQIKRYKQKKEKGRFGTVANRKYQERLRIDFDTADADTIQINVRINNRKQSLGKKITIKNIYFGTPTERKIEATPKLEVVPGFNAASIYIGQRQAKRASEFSAKIKYRESGSEKWINGLDLVYDESRAQARGSLLGLKEAAKYEFVIDVNDAGKLECIKGKFTTRDSNFPIGKTIMLTKDNARKLLSDIENGTAKGYTRYTSKPGEVLDFGIGKDHAIDLTNCQYVILDGLTIRGGLRHAVMIECANDIVVRNCDISGYGRVGKRNIHIDGKFFIKKQSINYDAGVNIQASERVTVERCFIHSPRGTANSWFYSHPAGPTAVYTGDAASVVLRYNDFIGSDMNRWNDAVEGWGNGALNGSVRADAEIYGNYFAFGNDDGMEMDGGQMNCRFAYNKSEGLLCGFSTAPCLIGPAYHFRNLVHRGGDEYDFTGVGVKNNFSTGGRGALFFFNNTVLDHSVGFSSVSFNATEKKMHREKYLKVYGRNNLVRTDGKLYASGLFRPQYFYSSVDNDLLDGPSSSVRELKAINQASATKTAKIKFENEKYGNYAPAQDSPAIDLGVFVPGVTAKENITIGAIQKRGDELPLRFAPFKLDRSVVTLKMMNDETEQAVVTITPDKNCRGKFRIVKPKGAYFFTVTPAEGKFDGKPVQLVVKSLPGKISTARRHTSAFSVRMCDGWSRPVSVEVDSRSNAKLLAQARESVIHGKVTRKKGVNTITVEVPEDGYYWLFAKYRGAKNHIASTINGVAEKNKRMLHRPAGCKYPWCSYSTTVYQGVPNRPVKLKKGLNTIVARGETIITAFAATKDADSLRLAPDDL